ncbi:MAG: hypothetical protein ACTSR8_08520 [Promethearchaeota archaeon]
MNPSTLISYIDKIEQVFVQSSLLDRLLEEFFMRTRATGTYYNSIEVMFPNCTLNCF